LGKGKIFYFLCVGFELWQKINVLDRAVDFFFSLPLTSVYAQVLQNSLIGLFLKGVLKQYPDSMVVELNLGSHE
jgi:hypothetical protein